MWHHAYRRAGGFGGGFRLDFAPFGFYFRGGMLFPSRRAYLRMLQSYKEELEEELKEVEAEIKELTDQGAPESEKD